MFFFAHENQACPPSISLMGKLRTGTKSDQLGCLEDLVPSQESSPSPSVQVSIIDGAAIVNMLQPGVTKKFTDYAKQVFMPYIVSQQLQHVSRLDVVWDKYFPHSLKADTHSKRGKGVRRCVESQNAVPGNWKEFLHSDVNKVELFSFLESCIKNLDTEKQLITTHHC